MTENQKYQNSLSPDFDHNYTHPCPACAKLNREHWNEFWVDDKTLVKECGCMSYPEYLEQEKKFERLQILEEEKSSCRLRNGKVGASVRKRKIKQYA